MLPEYKHLEYWGKDLEEKRNMIPEIENEDAKKSSIIIYIIIIIYDAKKKIL